MDHRHVNCHMHVNIYPTPIETFILHGQQTRHMHLSEAANEQN